MQTVGYNRNRANITGPLSCIGHTDREHHYVPKNIITEEMAKDMDRQNLYGDLGFGLRSVMNELVDRIYQMGHELNIRISGP